MTDLSDLIERVEAAGEGSRESRMVVIQRDEAGRPSIWCDPEIADLVSALNEGGIKTVASCSGHGITLGSIALADGRELIIARDFSEARKIRKSFPAERVPTPLMAAKAKLRSQGFRVTGNGFPIGKYRIRNFAAGIDYEVSQEKLIEIAASLRAHQSRKDG